MKVMSWNVDGTFPPAGSPDSIEEQIEWFSTFDTLPQVLLLQEVNHNRSDHWYDLLCDQLGYHTIRGTLDLAAELEHSNGHITALRGRGTLSVNIYDPEDSGFRPTDFPEKILVTEVARPETTIEVWNIRAVPGNDYGEEKIKIHELAYHGITEGQTRPRILAGDFNSPDRELADGQAVPFGYNRDKSIRERWVNAELNLLKGLGHLGMVDVFRAQHGYGDLDVLDKSWDRQKRFDHIIASQELTHTECCYLPDGYEYSDHAPIVAEFDV
ncbi:endonuclease/exonuclease/phosphatase family protein [Haloarcula sp. 1CSR25-25]|uniref:endonuclease/exonuclease/phosphatase family protein n=1 Tax=Haloarcula sp. 1CSR25-25 TaxID=2862545 RepID=UPI0028944B82|nr:endonuclease/exonuclease/phosphatase family protein [Haloarcula sp. 1CSR25-25]MDT3434661.1 endonuclease/exonuclease/phosphatase family protein [Haloarcula sp. 1CSR25-25]